jgi:type I restriction enzyme S subunit
VSVSGYPEYTESGIPWLGVIPSDWQLLPFFSRFSERRISNKGMKCNNLLSLSYGRIVNKDITTLDGLLPASFETYQIVHIDDIVFRLTDLQNDKRSLRSAIVSEKGIITSAYLAVMAHGFDAAFSSYLFRAYDLMKVFYSMGGGLRQSMKYDDMKWLMIAAPTVNEQTQIARFLDHETAKIDTLIHEQKRLIELLKEKRQAVISHAVTKGLDPDVPMKDSGVEWLGEIPAHWDTSKFAFISIVVRGGSPRPAGDPALFDGDYSPWVTVAEITKDDEIYLRNTETCLTKKGSDQCRTFSSGTLLISNSGATLGVPKILSINANANDGVVGFEQLQIDSEFAYFYLSSLTENLRERIKQGSGQPNLNTDIVKAISVPIPPSIEIKAIVDEIHRQRTKYSNLITEAEVATGLLKERRSAIISAAVTGKIDVRNWQKPADGSAFDKEVRQANIEAET